jgi:hypothetical protein
VPSQLVHFAKRHEGAYVLIAGGLVWVLVGSLVWCGELEDDQDDRQQRTVD